MTWAGVEPVAALESLATTSSSRSARAEPAHAAISVANPFRGRPDAGRTGLCHSAAVGRTVLIVDDHAGFRSAARALLVAGGFDVVGEAEDGTTALAAVEELRPEVLLLDVHLPDIDGFSVAARLPADGPVVVLTSSRSVASLRWRLEANPAWGFVPKGDLTVEALVTATAG